MFSQQIGLKPLSNACRSLSIMLYSGVDVKRAFAVASEKTFDPRCRRAMEGVSDAISEGEEVATAMREQGSRFPNLTIDMVEVGEKTGSMPEVLQSLADHYENNLRLRRDFYSAIAWPLIQLFASIFIIAFAIFVLGLISKPGARDVLGLGLVGVDGAVIWLTSTLGSLMGMYLLFQFAKSSLTGRKFLDPILIQIPVVGGCIRSFAVARFSWAFSLTQRAGMNIKESLQAALRATTNGAFLSAGPQMWAMVKAGEPLCAAFRESRLFSSEFIHMVDVAETSGTVPEMLDRLSPQFEEQARRSLSMLTMIFGWLIYSAVAVFIIFLIFKIIMSAYINPIYEQLDQM